MGIKQIVVDVVTFEDGSFNQEATDRNYFNVRDTWKAKHENDFDSVAVDVSTFLISLPGAKSIATPALVRGIYTMRAENGAFKGKTQEEKDAVFERLSELVPEYVKTHPENFHMGKKLGIAIRHVPGHVKLDDEGNPVTTANGEQIPVYRYTDEEWSKLTAKKEKDAEPSSTRAAAQ